MISQPGAACMPHLKDEVHVVAHLDDFTRVQAQLLVVIQDLREGGTHAGEGA